MLKFLETYYESVPFLLLGAIILHIVLMPVSGRYEYKKLFRRLNTRCFLSGLVAYQSLIIGGIGIYLNRGWTNIIFLYLGIRCILTCVHDYSLLTQLAKEKNENENSEK
ncbi:MAG: hypothetical protein IJH39_10870 [Clostridia bacterium]|nr:hypothetical protein [Clostridia bacterium]